MTSYLAVGVFLAFFLGRIYLARRGTSLRIIWLQVSFGVKRRVLVLLGRAPQFAEGRLQQLVRIRAALNEYARRHGSYPINLIALETYGLLPNGATALPDLTYHAADQPYPPKSAVAANASVAANEPIPLLEDAREGYYRRTAGPRTVVYDSHRVLLHSSGPPEFNFTRTSWSGRTPLHLAGSVDKARRLIDAGAKVNARDQAGRTPLHSATLNANTELMDLLLSRGAFIDAADYFGLSPLCMIAMEAGQRCRTCSGGTICIDYKPVIDLLLARGARVSIFTACALGDRARVAELLGMDASLVRARIRLRESPLHVAAAHGHAQIVSILLDHHADPKAVDYHGATPLRVAAMNGHLQVAELLASRGAPLDIHSAAALGMADRVAAMLQADPGLASSIARDRDVAGTPLHWAAIGPNSAVAERLLARGADANAVHEHHGAPLHVAIAFGQREFARWLLVHGANVNASDALGRTPLHVAVACDDPVFVRMLLDAGADVNSKAGPAGFTPLMLAAQHGMKRTAELLLALGADPTVRAASGGTALAIAEFAGDEEFARMLRE